MSSLFLAKSGNFRSISSITGNFGANQEFAREDMGASRCLVRDPSAVDARGDARR
jgi:hypothetical protein